MFTMVLTLVVDSTDAVRIQFVNQYGQLSRKPWMNESKFKSLPEGAMFWSRQGVRKKTNFLCASWVFQRATRWYFPLPTTTWSKPAFTIGILGDIFLFKHQSQVTTGSLFMITKKYTEGWQHKCIVSQLWRSLYNLDI